MDWWRNGDHLIMMEQETNPNVVTHEVNVGGGQKLVIADDLRDGYGDIKSFGNLTEDAVGDATGDDALAKAAAEDAMATYDYRADLTMTNMAKQQRKNKDMPYVRLFRHNNGQDVLMLVCAWDADKECQVGIIAHCRERADGGTEETILSRQEIRL